jgi:APA family basic amino acid/polyamine antiporter
LSNAKGEERLSDSNDGGTTESAERASTAEPAATSATSPPSKLAAKLGLFDAAMIVMGGVIGSGIFVNPAAVARQVHSPVLIIGAWVLGGALALLGAMIFAELGAILPKVGGEYAYLSAGIHPIVGFLYGWFALLVINAGGTAAVALVFAKYLAILLPVPIPERVIAAATIMLFAVINCLGVRFGSNVQSALMILRAVAALILIVASVGWYLYSSNVTPLAWRPVLDRPGSLGLAAAFGSAMIPVFFAYGGWQTGNFLAAEMRDPRKNLPRALLLGTLGVVALYVGVTFACLAVLGPAGLAATSTPASDVMLRVLGTRGAALMAVGIAISTLGFLSQSVLTYPRVFFAMAEDGLFPAEVSRVHARTQVPVVAILMASLLTVAVVAAGHYDAILVYVESIDGLFMGLTAVTLFVFRRRLSMEPSEDTFRNPGHPWTTIIFIAAYWLVVANSLYRYRANAVLVLVILLAGVPLYFYWKQQGQRNRMAAEAGGP